MLAPFLSPFISLYFSSPLPHPIPPRLVLSLMASSPGVSARQGQQTSSSLPKFMPPVTLDSSTPHPYLPHQPDKSQFIVQPKEPQSRQLPVSLAATAQTPEDILSAAKLGHLEWVKHYATAGQTELLDSMGEVMLSTFLEG